MLACALLLFRAIPKIRDRRNRNQGGAAVKIFHPVCHRPMQERAQTSSVRQGAHRSDRMPCGGDRRV